MNAPLSYEGSNSKQSHINIVDYVNVSYET